MKKLFAFLTIFFCFQNAYAQWQRIYTDNSLGAMQTQALNQDTVFAAGNFGLFLKTVNGGVSWDTISFPNTQTLRFQFINQLTGFVAGGTSFITGPTAFKTSDGGLSWQPMNFNANNYPAVDLFFLDADTGFISYGSDFGKTVDGGNNFSYSIIGDSFNRVNDIYFLDRKTGFVATKFFPVSSGSVFAENRIYKTTDQGATWSLVYSDSDLGNNSFIFAGITKITFVNDTFGIATGGEGKILKTTNAGNTWTAVPNNFPDYDITDAQFLSETKGYICYGGKIYVTDDGMQNWQKQADSSYDYYAISMLNDSLGYAAGHGIFKTMNGGGITAIKDISANTYFQIYPNPATDRITISYAKDVKIYGMTLISMEGKKIKTFSSAERSLLLRDVAPGNYLLRVFSNKGNAAKMILLR